MNFLEFSVKGSVQRIIKVNSSRIAGIAGENEPDISGVHTTTRCLNPSYSQEMKVFRV